MAVFQTVICMSEYSMCYSHWHSATAVRKYIITPSIDGFLYTSPPPPQTHITGNLTCSYSTPDSNSTPGRTTRPGNTSRKKTYFNINFTGKRMFTCWHPQGNEPPVVCSTPPPPHPPHTQTNTSYHKLTWMVIGSTGSSASITILHKKNKMYMHV